MPKLSRSPLGALLPFQRFDRVDDHGKYLSDPVTTADYMKWGTSSWQCQARMRTGDIGLCSAHEPVLF